MKTIYMKLVSCMQWGAFLLLVGIMSACNDDGIETIVIEDGQPSAAEMIIGQWFPNRGERIDEDGNVTNEPIDDSPGFNIYDDGTFDDFYPGSGDPGNTGGGKYKWNVDEDTWIGGGGGYDEKGPSVYLHGVRWYILQLTKKIFIIYRVTDRYILVYYYYRIGEFDGGGDVPEPDYSKVTKIVETVKYSDNKYDNTNTYTFSYDDDNRISRYVIQNNKYSYSWNYTYKGKEGVNVEGDENHYGWIGSNGYLTSLSISPAVAPTVNASYNDKGYLTSINNGKVTLKYDRENNLTSVGYYTYEYSKEKNDANIDLNCLISSCSMAYEVYYSHFSLFAPFGFYGKFSTNMISKETGDNFDWYNVYTYKRDGKNRIEQVVRKSISRFDDEILNTTTFDISYE